MKLAETIVIDANENKLLAAMRPSPARMRSARRGGPPRNSNESLGIRGAAQGQG